MNKDKIIDAIVSEVYLEDIEKNIGKIRSEIAAGYWYSYNIRVNWAWSGVGEGSIEKVIEDIYNFIHNDLDEIKQKVIELSKVEFSDDSYHQEIFDEYSWPDFSDQTQNAINKYKSFTYPEWVDPELDEKEFWYSEIFGITINNIDNIINNPFAKEIVPKKYLDYAKQKFDSFKSKYQYGL